MHTRPPRLLISSEGPFFVVMAFSAALSLVRGFLVAAVLPVEGFATYAVIVAVGSFLSIIVSAGRVELSMKSFPRLWLAGRHAEIIGTADRTAWVMAARTGGFLLAATIAAALVGRSTDFPEFVTAPLFALAMALISNFSSALRASGDLHQLALVTLTRAVLALALAVLGAHFAGWAGAITGEIAGALVVVVYARRAFRLSAARSRADALVVEAGEVNRGGLWLFGATLLAAALLYLDRAFVAWYLGPAQTGSYAFLMLFNLGASTVVGILVQSAGPTVIQMARRGAGLKVQLGYLIPRALFVIGLVGLGMAVAGYALLVFPLAPLGSRYGVTTDALVAVTILCVLQCSVFLDWVLMAQDKDRFIFAASAANMLAAVLGAGLAVTFGLTTTWLVWLLAVARAAQVCVQALGLMSGDQRRPDATQSYQGAAK